MYSQIKRLNPLTDWHVIADCASSIHDVRNRSLLTNIRRVVKGVKVHTGGGQMTRNLKGTFVGRVEAWHDPKGMANILSVGLLATQYRVVMDSNKEDAIFVKWSDTDVWKFTKFGNGLYCCDVR